MATRQVVSETVEVQTPEQAAEQIVRRMLAYAGENAPAAMTIDAVGCRIVHGGARFVQPTRVTLTTTSKKSHQAA